MALIVLHEVARVDQTTLDEIEIGSVTVPAGPQGWICAIPPHPDHQVREARRGKGSEPGEVGPVGPIVNTHRDLLHWCDAALLRSKPVTSGWHLVPVVSAEQPAKGPLGPVRHHSCPAPGPSRSMSRRWRP